MKQPRGTRLLAASSIVWILLVIAGLVILWRYSLTAGPASDHPGHWPPSASTPIPADHPVMVLFLHPQCPCSRATIRQLARIQSKTQDRIEYRIFFLQPDGFSSDWVETDLWRSASEIPGAKLFHDRNGSEARLFGARTSGQAVLYDSRGRLSFAGGITPGRGHEGDSKGSDAVIAFARTGNATCPGAPTYGCSLFSREGPASSPANQ